MRRLTEQCLSLSPKCSVNKRYKVEPHRLQAAIPSVLTPGVVGHIDMGFFPGPHGSFCAAIQTDAYSIRYAGGEFTSSHPTAEETIEGYVQTVHGRYEKCHVDLGSNFDCQPFRNPLEHVGCQFYYVATQAHLANKSEKGVELLKVELASVFPTFVILQMHPLFVLRSCSLTDEESSRTKRHVMQFTGVAVRNSSKG